jgi:tripartite-type tricarboxylate transporter receptor subunit TctC
MEKENRRGGIRTFFLLLILSMVIPSVPAAWAAEEPYPNRPINILVGYTPGGVLDYHAKLIGDYLSEMLGQPIIKIHKPGGGGTLAASMAAKAKPDGYTFFMGTSSSMVFSPLVKKVDYTWEDFIPLGIYSKGVVHCFVKADSPYKTLQDLIDDAKKRPGQLRVSSYGKMTPADFVIEFFSKQAAIKLAHVPYKSCGEAVTALLGGHAEADFCTASMGQMEAGTVRILASADFERSKFLPEVKTFRELGFPVAMGLWTSFCVPQKTPQNIVDKLTGAMQEVLKRHGKEIQDGLIKIEFLPYFLDLPQSIQEIKRDYEMQYKMAKELGVLVK